MLISRRIATLYAIFAVLWIAASHVFLATVLHRPVLITMAQTYQDLLFVTVTAALLYFIARRTTASGPAWQTPFCMPRAARVRPQTPAPMASLAGAWLPVTVFAVLALAIGATGYAMFGYQTEVIKRDKQENLAAIADLKVKQIARWIAERRDDAQVFERDAPLAAEVHDWLERGGPNNEVSRAIRARLQSLKEA